MMEFEKPAVFGFPLRGKPRYDLATMLFCTMTTSKVGEMIMINGSIPMLVNSDF